MRTLNEKRDNYENETITKMNNYEIDTNTKIQESALVSNHLIQFKPTVFDLLIHSQLYHRTYMHLYAYNFICTIIQCTNVGEFGYDLL